MAKDDVVTKQAPTAEEIEDGNALSGVVVKNPNPRMLNITATHEGGETLHLLPGRSYELTKDQVNNKHVKAWVAAGVLVKGEQAGDVDPMAESDATLQADQAKVAASKTFGG
jgi:hypothetical protein